MSPKARLEIINEEWRKQTALSQKPALLIDDGLSKDVPISSESSTKEWMKIVSIKAHDVSLTSVLKPLAQSIGVNVLLGPGVEDKKTNIDAQNMTIASVFNTILYSLGYGYKIEDKQMTVLAEQTQIFRVLIPPIIQSFDDTTSNESFVRSGENQNGSSQNQQVKLGTKIVVGTQNAGLSFWDDVLANVKGLTSDSARISLNKPAGMVVVTDTPVKLERLRRYFEDLNARVSVQIEVDVKVVEVRLNHDNRFGIDWNVLAGDLKTLNSIGLATNFASSNFSSGNFLRFYMDGAKEGSGISSNGFKMAINALSKQGEVEVVSQPRVKILNNQVSVIQVGSTQSYVDRSTIETTQTGSVTSVSTSQVQEGVTMRLLANIAGDDIFLSVTPVVTSIDNIRTIVSGNSLIEAPQTTTKSLNTMVKLKEGQTVAIGGLITSAKEHSKQSVPLLSKVPFLGRLFEYEVRRDNKTELIIFITPRKG